SKPQMRADELRIRSYDFAIDLDGFFGFALIDQTVGLCDHRFGTGRSGLRYGFANGLGGRFTHLLNAEPLSGLDGNISGKTARAARKIPRKAARVGLLLGSGFRLFAETLLPECSRTQYKDQCETDYERACFSDLGGAEVGWRVLNAG